MNKTKEWIGSWLVVDDEMNRMSRRNDSSTKASIVSSEGVTNGVLVVYDYLLSLVHDYFIRDKLEVTDHDGH